MPVGIPSDALVQSNDKKNDVKNPKLESTNFDGIGHDTVNKLLSKTTSFGNSTTTHK